MNAGCCIDDNWNLVETHGLPLTVAEADVIFKNAAKKTNVPYWKFLYGENGRVDDISGIAEADLIRAFRNEENRNEKRLPSSNGRGRFSVLNVQDAEQFSLYAFAPFFRTGMDLEANVEVFPNGRKNKDFEIKFDLGGYAFLVCDVGEFEWLQNEAEAYKWVLSGYWPEAAAGKVDFKRRVGTVWYYVY